MLSHSKARKQVGLALGGGVVRGMAHVGVLAVLEAAGVPVDFIAGSSAGAFVGACYCAGWSAEQLHTKATELRWRHWMRPTWPRRGLVSFNGLSEWMVRELGDLHFRELHLPFVVLATDLVCGEQVTLNQGPVAPAVQASCSVPFFVSPVELEGRLLGDGSLANTLPVSTLREMGADYVIGVDVFAPALRRWTGPFGYGFAALEIMVRNAGGGTLQADCRISPDLSGKTYMRFSKMEELYHLGIQAAEAMLPKICADLGR